MGKNSLPFWLFLYCKTEAQKVFGTEAEAHNYLNIFSLMNNKKSCLLKWVFGVCARALLRTCAHRWHRDCDCESFSISSFCFYWFVFMWVKKGWGRRGQKVTGGLPPRLQFASEHVFASVIFWPLVRQTPSVCPLRLITARRWERDTERQRERVKDWMFRVQTLVLLHKCQRSDFNAWTCECFATRGG